MIVLKLVLTLLFALFVCTFDVARSQNTVQNASITPSNPSANGVSTNILIPTDVIETSSEWQVTVSTQTNFHFKLSLDKSWGFNPFEPSKLRLIINSNTPTINSNDNLDLDLIISFSVLNSQFYTIMLRMDNNGDNWIYPSCDTSIPPVASIATGNVYEAVNNVNNYHGKDRNENAANGKYENYHDMIPRNRDNFINEWPIIFDIENHPIDNYVLFTYSNPSMNIDQYQSCGFSPSFLASSGMDIFIAGDEMDEMFNITSFELMYTTNGTFSPTTSPTQEPTMQPTISPTLKPTQNETSDTNTTTFFTTDQIRVIPNATKFDDDDDNKKEHGIFAVLGNKLIFYIVIISCTVICVLCIMGVIIVQRKKMHNKKMTHLRRHCSTSQTGVIDYNNFAAKSSTKSSKFKRKRDSSMFSTDFDDDIDIDIDVEGSEGTKLNDHDHPKYSFKEHLSNVVAGNNLMMKDVIEDIINPDLIDTPDGTPESEIPVGNIKMKPQFVSSNSEISKRASSSFASHVYTALNIKNDLQDLDEMNEDEKEHKYENENQELKESEFKDPKKKTKKIKKEKVPTMIPVSTAESDFVDSDDESKNKMKINIKQTAKLNIKLQQQPSPSSLSLSPTTTIKRVSPSPKRYRTVLPLKVVNSHKSHDQE